MEGQGTLTGGTASHTGDASPLLRLQLQGAEVAVIATYTQQGLSIRFLLVLARAEVAAAFTNAVCARPATAFSRPLFVSTLGTCLYFMRAHWRL